MSPQPQPEQCMSELQSSAAANPLSLLASASASIGDDVQSASSSHQDSPKFPLHKTEAEKDDLPQLSSSQHGNRNGNAQKNTDTLQQLDARILSQMVTASMPGDTAEKTSIRVASMQEFRKASRNSLSSVPESSGLHRKTGNASPRTSFAMVSNPVGGKSDNPLLKLMEQRMATKQSGVPAAAPNDSQAACTTSKKTPAMATMTNEQKSALDASINRWSGIGSRAAATSSPVDNCTAMNKGKSTSNLRTVDERSASKCSPTLTSSPSQTEILQRLSNNDGSSKSRKPLDASQEQLIHELIQTQHSTPQPTFQRAKERVSAQDFVAQVLLQQQLQQQQQQEQSQLQLRAMGMYAPVSQGGMNRSVASISELDRLRSMNQSVQMQQQIALQSRRSQQCLLQRQRQSSSGNIRLSSSALPNSMMMRKRRSSNTTNDDDTLFSSRSPSLSSNTSSSKIHRSDSHSYVSSSMENLRLSRSRPSRLNIPNQLRSSSGLNAIRNQSFSSSLSMQHSSVSSSLDMQNQRFSTGSALGSSVRRSSSKAAMKRSTSSSSWIQSMISSQQTAGKAASAAHQLSALASNMEQHQLHQLVLNNALTSSSVKESNDSATNAPIQVTAEEFPAPPIERDTSETVILSDLPDRIKFQDVQVDKKPIDVVKDCLSSRGEDSNIKPTMDMRDDFFDTCEDMYIKEAMDAVRSSDVETLRQLVAAGKNLQCGNRFGESLVHLACRRSHHDVVTFLIKEARVSIKLRDDYGRTPMHDACWRCEVDLHLMDLLIDTCPELLMLSDKRGHTPLDYARREHWDVLIPYLMKKKDSFRPIK